MVTALRNAVSGMPRRLLFYCEFSRDGDSQQMVAMVDSGGNCARSNMLSSLTDKVARRHYALASPPGFVSWVTAQNVLSGQKRRGYSGSRRGWPRRTSEEVAPAQSTRAPARTHEHPVPRVGRDAFLAERRAGTERSYCKADRYACCSRDAQPQQHGPVVGYDCVSQAARSYAAKLRACYGGDQAEKDYDGIPTLLFVTTGPSANPGLTDRARFAQGTEPLPIPNTTSGRITADGILGPLWQPLPVQTADTAALRVWPAGGRLGQRACRRLRPSATCTCCERNGKAAYQ
jgi:hypothetical protein